MLTNKKEQFQVVRWNYSGWLASILILWVILFLSIVWYILINHFCLFSEEKLIFFWFCDTVDSVGQLVSIPFSLYVFLLIYFYLFTSIHFSFPSKSFSSSLAVLLPPSLRLAVLVQDFLKNLTVNFPASCVEMPLPQTCSVFPDSGWDSLILKLISSMF